MEELDYPINVLEHTEEGDELTIQLLERNSPMRTIVQKHFTEYDNTPSQKWKLDEINVLVFHDLSPQIKQIGKDGFLKPNGKTVTKLTNETKELMATKSR